MRLYRLSAMCLATAFTAVVLVGCSENNGSKPKVQRVEGVAKSIDLENNVVSMTTKDDKGGERDLTGSVREDTVVLINGRSHTLKDVRVGDQVVVFGYKEGTGDAPKLIATKVEVTRAQESDWKSTGPGASSPTPPPATSPPEATKPMTQPPKPAEQPADATKPGSGASREEAAAQLTDMIYAQIRIRMEEAIAKRAELLKAGKPASDPEVRKQEEIIMNARTRLLEAGEVVPEIDPPIVQTTPATAPPATPPPASPPAGTPPPAQP